MSCTVVQGDEQGPWNASLSGLCPKTPQPLPHPGLRCQPLLRLLLAFPSPFFLPSLPLFSSPPFLLLLSFPSSPKSSSFPNTPARLSLLLLPLVSVRRGSRVMDVSPSRAFERAPEVPVEEYLVTAIKEAL